MFLLLFEKTEFVLGLFLVIVGWILVPMGHHSMNALVSCVIGLINMGLYAPQYDQIHYG